MSAKLNWPLNSSSIEHSAWQQVFLKSFPKESVPTYSALGYPAFLRVHLGSPWNAALTFKKKSGRLTPRKKVALTPNFRQIQVTREEPRKRMSAMTNIVEQLFKSLDPWPGFQITSFKIQVSPVDGRKTLILDLRPVEGSMPTCSRCRHEAPLVHGYVSRRIKERSL